MSRDKLQRIYHSKIFKHLLIILIICISAWLFLLVMVNFVRLHPDAYRDLIRSILIPYAVGILVFSIYKASRKNKGLSGVTGKLSEWWENSTPIEDICLTFTLITLINSIMMLVGIDTPKQGVFAYIHMMTRLGIVTFIVTLITWKDVWNRGKKFRFNNTFRHFYREAHKHVAVSVSILFTTLTAIYCIVMIIFRNLLDPSGGAFFYQVLLGLILLLTLFFMSLRFIRSK